MVVFEFYTPFPAAMLIATMHVVSDILNPLHMYPYTIVLMRISSESTAVLLALCCTFRVCEDVGWRLALMLLVSVFTLHGLSNENAAFGIVSVYYCCIHTPLYYMKRARAKSYFTLCVSTLLTLIGSVAAYQMPYISKNLTLGPLAQQLFTAHLLVEKSKTKLTRSAW